jgi:hypothetical protein
MQILIDVTQGSAGRLTGAIALTGDGNPLPFSGNLELLARIEDLCHRPPPPTAADPPKPTHSRSI